MSEATPSTPAPTAPAVAPRPKPKMLAESNFKQAAYRTNRWSVTLPVEVPFDRVFDTDYWSHVARNIRIGDIIEVHAEDTTFFAELYVVAAHRLAAKVVLLRKVDLVGKNEIAPLPSVLSVKYRGPANRYCIMRGAEVVQSGFQTVEEAELAKANLNKAYAA